jgi:hypothetical protein
VGHFASEISRETDQTEPTSDLLAVDLKQHSGAAVFSSAIEDGSSMTTQARVNRPAFWPKPGGRPLRIG